MSPKINYSVSFTTKCIYLKNKQTLFGILFWNVINFENFIIYQVLPALFSELHRLLRGTIENIVVAVVSPLEYIRIQQVETLRKLGIQAVHRTD
jgi:hypothetical protein